MPEILQARSSGTKWWMVFSRPLSSMLEEARGRPALHWVVCFLDIVIAAGICICTFYICEKWQGNISPDVWAHINWARKIATTQSHSYGYMPGAHILIWFVTKVFSCSEYEAATQLPVFFRIYLGLVTYFAGSRVLNRTAGLMLTLLFLASPVMATELAPLFLPRDLAHPLFLLGLLLTVDALSCTPSKTRSLVAAGIAFGTTVITHLAWDEILQIGSLAVILMIVMVLNRRLFKRILTIILAALVVAGPFMARMVFNKFQPNSFFNISLDRLVPFGWEKLSARANPSILWVGVVSLIGFVVLEVGRHVLKKGKLHNLPREIEKPGLLCAVWGILAAVSFFLLLCVGKGKLEAFVYGTLPLPHPINTEHFFTMLTFGLLGAAAMIGYLPAYFRGKWKLLAIGIVVLAFVLILAIPLSTSDDNIKRGFVSTGSISMWSLFVLATLLADYHSCILSKVKKSRLVAALVIIFVSITAAISMPSIQPVKQFSLQSSVLDIKLSALQQRIVRFAHKDAVIVSAWPYLDSIEYLLGRRIEDGLLGPGALWSAHRGRMPGKYWHTLQFANDRIANAPEQIVEALHADFGPRVYLYFRAESIRAFTTHKRISSELTAYTSAASKEIFGQPAVENPRKRFLNMITYFRTHSRYFKQAGQDNQSVLFKVIE
ncbi:hypothetical protein ES703_96073 [subsurface metagenome]